MTAVLWFVAGIAVGVNVSFAYAWLSLRRANRKAVLRLEQHVELDDEGIAPIETSNLMGRW